jgi:hypothetical protein
MTTYLTKAKKIKPPVPAIKGEATHEMKSFLATSHSTDENPLAAMENPMMHPTMSWVVETGRP